MLNALADTQDLTAHKPHLPLVSLTTQPPFPKTAPRKSPPTSPDRFRVLVNNTRVDSLAGSVPHKSAASFRTVPQWLPVSAPLGLQTTRGCICLWGNPPLYHSTQPAADAFPLL